MIELGIVDTKNIIKTLSENYNLDFSDYALTSIKRRIERIMDLYNFKYPDILVHKLIENRDFIDSFIYEISVPSTEMFRDPSLWRQLRDDIIPNLKKESRSGFKIWLPNSVSGDELFSLAILLSEMNLLEEIQILVSSVSDKGIDIMKSGVFNPQKLDISSDNYIRANGSGELSNYYQIENNIITRNRNLLKNVSFFKQNLYGEPVAQGVKLVLFRNKMIYYNQQLQWRIIKNIYSALNPGGMLIIGTKETLSNLYGSIEFTLISNNESIYKRK
jgi:chemotaxis protein methyltransferase CheR